MPSFSRYPRGMTTRRSVLSFSRGPFKPHGDVEYWTEDRLLRYVAHGPFNREAFAALAEASRQLHAAQPFQRSFAHLTEIRGNAMATPGAMETLEAFFSRMSAMGSNGLAVALVIGAEVEGRSIMAPLFERAYALLKLPFRCFETVDDARAWLDTILGAPETAGT